MDAPTTPIVKDIVVPATYSGKSTIVSNKYSRGVEVIIPSPGFPDSNYSVNVTAVAFENSNPFISIYDGLRFWIGGNPGDYLWTATNQNGEGGQGVQGPAGPAGPDGPIGPTGPTGTDATLSLGTYTSVPYGQPLVITNTGLTPSNAIFNFQIPQGQQGIQGNAGANGANGTNGTDGVGISSTSIQGDNLFLYYTNSTSADVGRVVGYNGTNGTNGINGTNGLGIANASINESGNLVFIYSDSTSQNVGKVVGPTGPSGINSLNGLTGAVSLVGSTGITITPSNNTLTIGNTNPYTPALDRSSGTGGTLINSTSAPGTLIQSTILTTDFIANTQVYGLATFQANSNIHTDVSIALYNGSTLIGNVFIGTITGINHYITIPVQATDFLVPAGNTTYNMRAWASTAGVVTLKNNQLTAFGNFIRG